MAGVGDGDEPPREKQGFFDRLFAGTFLDGNARKPGDKPTVLEKIAAPSEPKPKPPPTPKGHVAVRRIVITGGLLLILVIVMGFVHVIYGGAHTLKFCVKDEWSLGHTFIAADDAVRVALEDAHVYRALTKCIADDR